MTFEDALVDSVALGELAIEAGITHEAARAPLAALADMPMRQAIRLCSAADAHEKRIRRRA